MMRWNRMPIFLVALIAMVAAGCGGPEKTEDQTTSKAAPAAKATGNVVATVNGSPISMDEYKDRMERQSPYVRGRYNTLERKEEFLSNMIRFELLAQEAKNRGLDKDPEVLRAAKQVMIQKLTREQFDEKMDRNDIPEEDIRKYYGEHLNEYVRPGMVRASQILIKIDPKATQKDIDAAKKRALKIYKEVQKNAADISSFRKLAKQYSEDAATKNRGGDMGYFARTEEGGPLPSELSNAVWKLKEINDIAPLVKTDKGFHIVRLTGKRQPVERTLEQVRSQIRSRLFKEKRTEKFDAFVANLKNGASIDVNRELLESYDPAEQPGRTEAPKKMPENAKKLAPAQK